MIVVQHGRGRAAAASIAVVASLALTAATALAGTPPQLVKDINPGSDDSGPVGIIDDGGKALFAAFDPTRGRELWISDGTKAGTHVVVDANPGSGDGVASFAPAKIGSDFVYEGNDTAHGFEPWITDGTSAGTHMIKDINPGSGGSNAFQYAAWKGKVYFGAI